MSFQRRYAGMNTATGETFEGFATCITPRSNLAIDFSSLLPNKLLYTDQKFPPKFLKFPHLSQISPQTSAGLLRFLDVGIPLLKTVLPACNSKIFSNVSY